MQLENAGRILLESIRGADNSGGHMSIRGADAKGPKKGNWEENRKKK